MVFKIKLGENILELSRDQKRQKYHLITHCLILFSWCSAIIYELLRPGGFGLLMLPMFFLPLFSIKQLKRSIKIIHHGEVLVFDKGKAEFRINDSLQMKLKEIAAVELHFDYRVDIEKLYLSLIRMNNKVYPIEETNLLAYYELKETSELKETAKLLGNFLNVEVLNRYSR